MKNLVENSFNNLLCDYKEKNITIYIKLKYSDSSIKCSIFNVGTDYVEVVCNDISNIMIPIKSICHIQEFKKKIESDIYGKML